MKNLPQTIQVGDHLSWSCCPPGLCPLPSGLRLIFVFQEVKQYYEEYQQLKQQQREEAEAVQELTASKHFSFLGNRSDPLIGCTGGVSELSDFLSHLLMSRLSRGEEAKGQEAKGGVSRL